MKTKSEADFLQEELGKFEAKVSERQGKRLSIDEANAESVSQQQLD